MPDETPEFDPFKALKDFDSAPVLPVGKEIKIRFTTMAELLFDARIQGYIEANFGLQILRILQIIIPILAGAMV